MSHLLSVLELSLLPLKDRELRVELPLMYFVVPNMVNQGIDRSRSTKL